MNLLKVVSYFMQFKLWSPGGYFELSPQENKCMISAITNQYPIINA